MGKYFGTWTANAKEVYSIQHYYGLAIRKNLSSVEDVKRAIWAIYFHKLSTEDNPQHALCPLESRRKKRLKGSSPMLMEFIIPIFHIFSGLVVKKLPSSSVSPSGPPTEDRSDAPTHEALDNAYQHIRDLEKQVALSEGKLQESQRCFDSVISSLASHIESTVSCVSDLKSSMEHNTDTRLPSSHHRQA
ncbi:hypothetical protein TNCV_2592971 [Trichonephila clavipes]|nr:hypothetical protein TNCV_2592971 [Trichonephila clavipes]